MLRRSLVRPAGSIPRAAWDPLRHNHRSVDSYAQHMLDRRQWPAKKWAVGMEPRTRNDWLKFSLRNLAYQYNAALRACASFPEMVPLYQEMKERKVKLDVDTMVTMISRAARFDKMKTEDIFSLFDEMVQLGAKPDLAAVELMHTVWDNALSLEPIQKERRRLQLIGLYNDLALDDINNYGVLRSFPALLAKNMNHIRHNLYNLGGAIQKEVWKSYFATIHSFDILANEMVHFLWGLVEEGHASTELRGFPFTVPRVGDAMDRTDPSAAEWQDNDVCEVLLTAVERIVDANLSSQRNFPARTQFIVANSIIIASGVFLRPELLAQLMDIVKFSEVDDKRDMDAIRILKQAMKGSLRPDAEQRKAWMRDVKPVTGAIVGRYLAARDAWANEKFAQQGFKSENALFPEAQLTSVSPAAPAAEVDGDDEEASNAPVVMERIVTGKEAEMRWNNARQLLQETKVLERFERAEEAVEVYTGLIALLRSMVLGTRYTTDLAAVDRKFNVDVAAKCFSFLKQTKYEMDGFCSKQKVAPELEAWETVITLSRDILDQLVAIRASQSSEMRTRIDGLFGEVSEFYKMTVEESKERYGGRFRDLWLQEV